MRGANNYEYLLTLSSHLPCIACIARCFISNASLDELAPIIIEHTFGRVIGSNDNVNIYDGQEDSFCCQFHEYIFLNSQ